MLTTRYVTGSPNWLDLGTPDLEGARRFYGGVLGWTFRTAGPEMGGYGMFQLDGGTVAGAMTVPSDEGPPSWNVYFQTPDADATADAVRGAGGQVHLPPMDVADLGRMAIFSDPTGCSFGIWQPGANKGLDTAGSTRSLVWVELYTPDQEAALAFYAAVFGWGTSVMAFPGGSYTMTHPEDGGVDAMFGGVVPLASDPAETGARWLPYFAVADCDATVATADGLGGTVRMAPRDLED
ncbi:VOC family protein, partial [Streptomyces sp. NPDC057638]|uniref:VOC family protein n=1 Tax=Streptomyces sp. NPDC057638 TaxID=3346190 RepID=UPI003694D4BD